MVSEKELQEKLLIYRTLEARLDVLTRQRDLLVNRIAEILSTIESIEEMGKNPENILFRLGSNAYSYGKVSEKNKILVEIGAGSVLEKTPEESKQILNKRKEEMEKVLKNVQTNMQQVSNALEQLAPQINELIQKSQTESSAG